MAPLFQRRFTLDEEVERPKAAPETPVAAPGEVSTVENAAGGEKAAEAEAAAIEASQPSGTAAPESHEGLIPASKLPSAADTLAQLFAEAPAAEPPPAEKVEQPAAILETALETPAAEVTPRRQGLLARLFKSKRQPKSAAEEPAPVAPIAPADVPSEPAVATTAVAAAEAPIAEEPATLESASESLVLAEIPKISLASADGAPVVAAAELPIMAEELPPAADALEDLFRPEETSVVATPDASADTDADDEAIAEVLREIPVQATSEAKSRTASEIDFAELGQEHTESHEAPGALEVSPSSDSHGEMPVEAEAEIERGDAQLAAPLIETRDESTAEKTPIGRLALPEAPATDAAASDEDSRVANWEEGAEQITKADPPEAEAPRVPSLLDGSRRLYKDWAFDEKLASHGEWVESHGRTGQRADLSGAELEASDLISVNLRLADMHDANLRASDLLLADLRDACLVRADLEEACLVGANLEGANLEGASLETAMGLVPRQFAGANLRDALLAPHLMEFDAVTAFDRESKNAFRYFWITSVVSVLSWLLIAKTRDAQLLTDSAIIPLLRSRAAAAALPTAESYLILPAALFVVYVLLHFHLQRLWDAVAELPAIFPDGHMLGDTGPGIISGLLRTHFRWMNPDPTSTRLVEKSASLGAAYWIVPGTLLLFWARYLTRQETHGTILLAMLAAAAIGMATYATLKVGRRQERWAFENTWVRWALRKVKAINPTSVAAAIGVVLLLLSAGVIFGVPHDRSRAPQFGLANIRRWAPNAFWWLAYDPYPDLTEASISRRPANWNGSDEQVASVDGLRVNNAKFRYVQAYGAFFANAHLWRADFQGAFLSEADLRGADLGQSNMRYAVMDHAQMNHANLDRSNLDGADMRRADLRDANLSYCSLENTILVDARLDGASLYTARLPGATLTRAILEKADLRESQLPGAHMDHADLRSAYLWSAKLPGADMGGAQLQGAILIDADLHGANLGGAQLTGTVLNGADLSGTSLEGADLRGALGLSASQVCSAKSRLGAMLDPDMETQVEAQCGKQ